MAKFKPGQSGNPKGRPQGSKNKRPIQLQMAVADLVHRNFEQFEADLLQLKPVDRVKTMSRLFEFCIPRFKTSNYQINVDALSDEEVDRLLKHLLHDGQAKSTE